MTDEAQRRSLYPAIEPWHTGTLEVADGQALYYEQCGNPRGKPVVVLHGGPGAGCNAQMRRFFNPDVYRIVLFDQRGAGRSRPHALLENNTTWDLVTDIEVLRAALGIKRWQVFGGSWGSTLALAYAETHPERVTELVLRGIFLARRHEIQWLYQDGTSRIFPEAWQDYLQAIPRSERHDLLHAYHRRLTSDDPATCLAAAKAWSIWEGSTSQLVPTADVVEMFGADRMALAVARIECHYFVNGCFLEEGQLLAGIERVRRIPAVIVHGRYDVLCLAQNAWELSRAWPEARLRIVPDAGHSAFEPGNIHELVTATDTFA
ncbi:MAG TPA: prolyl aminopeptidase [Woeseiaceae bacterium]|nr:prolyl aminopeptidase [Woeseiaceae bacterium]